MIHVLSKVEILELPWQLLEEVIKRLREVRTLACIYYVRAEDIPFSKTIRNAPVREAQQNSEDLGGSRLLASA